MEPTLIVMITTLMLPNGDASVNVKPFPTPAICKEAADIEVSDPFVRAVECASLDNGELTLQFKRQDTETLLSKTKAGG